jgi:hypothetical protein
MAKFIPITDGDPAGDGPILNALSARVKKYVVTYTNIVTALRAVFGVYRTMRQAFIACNESKQRNVAGRALCWLVQGTNYFRVIADNEFTH